MGSKKETTYGTPLLDASLTQRVRFDAGDFFALAKEFYSDAEKAGKGHNWPTLHQEIMRADDAGQLNFDLDDWKAGWLGAFFFGNVATSGVGPYTHLFTFLTATNIFPVTSVYFEDTADIKTKWADLAINSLEISGTAERADLRGKRIAARLGQVHRRRDGRRGIPALQAAPIYLLGSDTDILIGAPAGAASIKERIRELEHEVRAGDRPHRAPGGGKVSTFHKVGKQRASFSARDRGERRRRRPHAVRERHHCRSCRSTPTPARTAQLNLKFPGAYVTAAQSAWTAPRRSGRSSPNRRSRRDQERRRELRGVHRHQRAKRRGSSLSARSPARCTPW
jgi:hypothetical protein